MLALRVAIAPGERCYKNIITTAVRRIGDRIGTNSCTAAAVITGQVITIVCTAAIVGRFTPSVAAA